MAAALGAAYSGYGQAEGAVIRPATLADNIACPPAAYVRTPLNQNEN